MDPRRAVRRASLVTVMTGLIAVLATVLAPVTLGANRLDVDVTLPAAFKISGKVTNTAGTALAGVSIFASEAGYADFGFATTNSLGNYVVQGLEPGSYTIQVSPPSTTNYRSGYYTTANTNHFTDNPGAATALTVGPSKTGINVKVPSGFTISGHITNTAGTALAGVSVNAQGPAFKYATTNSSGNYTIRGLPAGSYRIYVSGPFGSNYQSGYYTTANTNHFTTSYASATLVVVGPNRTGIDVKLPAGFIISGKITNNAGTALAGVSVSALSGPTYGSATTDASGNYAIRALNAGDYTLAVSPPSTINYRDGYYTTANTNHFTPNFGSATPVHVGPNKSGINVKLPSGFIISGMITNNAGTAIPGATVYGSGGSTFDNATATTNASGAYSLRGLDPDTYKLMVTAPTTTNYRNGWYTTANAAHFTDLQSVATGIVVGPNRTGVNIKLPTGYKIGDTILGAPSTPLAGVIVTASGPNGSEAAFTNSSGKYLIQGLRAGTYTVHVQNGFFSTGNYRDGYYKQGAAGNWTATLGNASPVTIGP
jgi:molybdopterin-binding protein